jgi:hypothetical protein
MEGGKCVSEREARVRGRQERMKRILDSTSFPYKAYL